MVYIYSSLKNKALRQLKIKFISAEFEKNGSDIKTSKYRGQTVYIQMRQLNELPHLDLHCLQINYF